MSGRGVTKKAKQKCNKVGAFFGLVIDDKLKAAVPDMNQEELEQRYKLNRIRKGSAVAGLALNTGGMLVWPAYAVGATLSLRQFLVARRTEKMIEQTMQAKQQASGTDQASTSVGHVEGTVRYFLFGAGMKSVLFVAFLGPVGAENMVINFLHPADMAASLPANVVASLPVHEMTVDLQNGVHNFFEVPHAFNGNSTVQSVQAIGNLPQAAVLGVGQPMPTWDQMYTLDQLTEQLVVGAATEANAPAMLGEKATEIVAEVWSKPKNDLDQNKFS